MDFSIHKNPSLVENPSIVDDLVLTKKSTTEGFQCTTFSLDCMYLYIQFPLLHLLSTERACMQYTDIGWIFLCIHITLRIAERKGDIVIAALLPPPFQRHLITQMVNNTFPSYSMVLYFLLSLLTEKLPFPQYQDCSSGSRKGVLLDGPFSLQAKTLLSAYMANEIIFISSSESLFYLVSLLLPLLSMLIGNCGYSSWQLFCIIFMKDPSNS